MSQNTRGSIVLITNDADPSGSIGTGFVIHHDKQISHVLTCAHVVKEVRKSGELIVQGHRAKVVALGDPNGCDLAVLEVEDGLTKLQELKLGAFGEKGRKFIVSGYYKDATKIPKLADISGKLDGTQIINDKKGDLTLSWDLDIGDDSKHKLKDGYSGSPVIDEASGYVLGVVTQRIGEKEGLAISIEALGKVWLEMPTRLIISSQKIKQGESNHSKGSTSISQLQIILQDKQEELDRKQIQIQELRKIIDDIERRRNLVDILEKARYDIRLEDLNIAYNRVKKDLENLSKEIEEVNNKLS
jgi:Trypsin-like peptidase domain